MNPLQKLWQWLKHKTTGAFLCDSCRYDYGDACRRPERPNAVICPEYKKGR